MHSCRIRRGSHPPVLFSNDHLTCHQSCFVHTPRSCLSRFCHWFIVVILAVLLPTFLSVPPEGLDRDRAPDSWPLVCPLVNVSFPPRSLRGLLNNLSLACPSCYTCRPQASLEEPFLSCCLMLEDGGE